MLQDHNFLYTASGKFFWYSTLVAVALILLLIANAAGAGNGQVAKEGAAATSALRLLKTVPIPGTGANTTNGKLYSFDISFVDQSTQTYYLADRSNVAVDVVDAATATLIGPISVSPPFAGVVPAPICMASGGSNCSGPNGVVAAYPWLFVTDGGSRVVNIDLRTGQIAPGGDIVTAAGDPNRADELAYDPDIGLLLVINNADTPPFGTLIKVDKTNGQLQVARRIPLPFATAGAEQPVWNPDTQKFYLSIPEINGNLTNRHGAVVRIDPLSATVDAMYPVDFCGPAGLTLGPDQQLLIGCNTVFDTAGNVWNPTGNVTAAPKDVILDLKTGSATDVPGVGAGDEVWYNSSDGNYYATGSGSPLRPTLSATAQGASALGVIDAVDRSLLQLVPTFSVPAVGTGNNSTEHPAGTAHSVAANAANNYILVPLAANNVFPGCLTGCITVFFRP